MDAPTHFDDGGREMQAIVDRIRKSIEEDASQIPMRCCADFRIRLDRVKRLLDSGEEIISETLVRTGIPSKRRGHVLLGERGEPNARRHGTDRRASALTSSHVRSATSLGSAKRSSRTWRCQSGTGTASGVLARLSQASSINRMRSAGGRRSTSSRIGREAILESCEVGLVRARAFRRVDLQTAPNRHDGPLDCRTVFG